jgi:hypothetical protein
VRLVPAADATDAVFVPAHDFAAAQGEFAAMAAQIAAIQKLRRK